MTARVHLLDGAAEAVEATTLALEVTRRTVLCAYLLDATRRNGHMIKFKFIEKVYFRLLGNMGLLKVIAVRKSNRCDYAP